MKKAEERALEFYPILFSERNGYDNTMRDRRISFENGYEVAEKDCKEMYGRIIDLANSVYEYWMAGTPQSLRDAITELRKECQKFKI